MLYDTRIRALMSILKQENVSENNNNASLATSVLYCLYTASATLPVSFLTTFLSESTGSPSFVRCVCFHLIVAVYTPHLLFDA